MVAAARSRLLSCVLGTLTLAVVPSCDLGLDLEEPDVGDRSSELWGTPGIFWEGATAGAPPMIPVCWENPGGGSIQGTGFSVSEATAREWVRDVVEGQWSRYGRVSFTEWDTCVSGVFDPGIHIRILKTGGSSSFGGNSLDGVVDGVKLNVYFDDRHADCQASLANLKRCVQATAVHEFGHALGFGHEEERADYVGSGTGDCAKQPTPPAGTTVYYGAYDIASVMSHCGQPNNDISTWKTELSPGNIAALQTAYGRRKSGQMANARGADMLAVNHFVGPAAFIWDADEASGQRWTYSFSTRRFKATSAGLTSCLTAGLPGLPMSGTGCTGNADQRFPLDDLFLRGFGGLCLDLPDGDLSNGTPLRVSRCGAAGGNNQRWRIDQQGRIRFGATNKCVTFKPATNAPLFLYDCGALPNQDRQSFFFQNDGAILFAESSSATFCMDVLAISTADYTHGIGLPNDGAAVQAFPCVDDQLNQKWNLSGAFRSENGKCIDVVNADHANGTSVQSFACNGTVAQQWDYYWRQ